MTKTSEYQFELNGLSEYLYESPYDDIFIQVFSNSKEFLGGTSSFRERVKIDIIAELMKNLVWNQA